MKGIDKVHVRILRRYAKGLGHQNALQLLTHAVEKTKYLNDSLIVAVCQE